MERLGMATSPASRMMIEQTAEKMGRRMKNSTNTCWTSVPARTGPAAARVLGECGLHPRGLGRGLLRLDGRPVAQALQRGDGNAVSRLEASLHHEVRRPQGP